MLIIINNEFRSTSSVYITLTLDFLRSNKQRHNGGDCFVTKNIVFSHCNWMAMIDINYENSEDCSRAPEQQHLGRSADEFATSFKPVFLFSSRCTDCGKTFPRLSLLVLHTEAFHSAGSATKPFSCGECGYGFKSARRLCEHARVAHDTSAMRCPQQGCDLTWVLTTAIS